MEAISFVRRSKIPERTPHCLGIMLAVISYVYEAMTDQCIITKRDIYYRDVVLFRSQGIVDDALARLTTHLGVQRFASQTARLRH